MTHEDDLARSEAILAAIPDIIFEVNAEGRFLFVHAKPGETFVENERIVGNLVTELLPENVAFQCMACITEALQTHEVQILDYTLPYPDQTRYFRAHMGASSKETVVAVVRNTTLDRNYQRKLERQADQLMAANESLEQFVHVASHDLREPLTGVAGFATLLRKRYGNELDENGQHFLDEIIAGTKHMEQKIEDLLLLSRAGRGVPNGPFPLGSAVEEARRSLVGSFKQSGAVLQTSELPMVHGDRSMIAQVFQNLFSNSIKYHPEGVKPVIEVEAHPDSNPEMIHITVTDNGIGFCMDHADRIFGIFQRLYTNEQYPGTGIGLAIAKKIVEKHGGRIWASSEPSKGATFHFTLQRATNA
jgi:signal transduction histidine kinase